MKFQDYLRECNRAQVVLLGPGRAGKTSMAYSVSHLGKTLGIEAEEGVHAARDYINADNLELETVTKRELRGGRWVALPPEKQPPIRDRIKELTMKAFSGGYKYVVVDSLTDIASRFEIEYARKTGTVSQNEWFKLIEGMKTVVHDLKNGDFNLICTCIAAPPKDGSLIEISASLPGQLREQMTPMFQSVVLLIYDKKSKRRKLVVNDPGRGLCDRFHSFGQDVAEVDVTGSPLMAIKTLMEGPQRWKEVAPESKDALVETVRSDAKKPLARPAARLSRPAVRTPATGGRRVIG